MDELDCDSYLEEYNLLDSSITMYNFVFLLIELMINYYFDLFKGLYLVALNVFDYFLTL
jgi:hypothetical protein